MIVKLNTTSITTGLALFLAGTLLCSSALAQVEARNDKFADAHQPQYQSWTQTQQSSERADALAEDPNMVILWAGSPFAKDYNKPRGHYYALTDVRDTLRTGAPKTAEDGPLPMA